MGSTLLKLSGERLYLLHEVITRRLHRGAAQGGLAKKVLYLRKTPNQRSTVAVQWAGSVPMHRGREIESRVNFFELRLVRAKIVQVRVARNIYEKNIVSGKAAEFF